METGTRLDFSKCSLVVEGNDSCQDYVLTPHHDLSHIGLSESMLVVATLLREGLPIVHTPDRSLLANQLEKLAAFCAGSGFSSIFVGLHHFMQGKDFVENSRTVQALIVMDSVLREGYAYKYEDRNYRNCIHVKGMINGYNNLLFLRDRQFKSGMTKAGRHVLIEAIIPLGDYLEATYSGKRTVIEGGTVLNFTPKRHFDSNTVAQTEYGADVFYDAVCAFEKDIAYVGDEKFEARIEPTCIGENKGKIVHGLIPLHWVTTQATNKCWHMVE